MGKFFAMMIFAIIVFLIVGYFGRYGPAQRHFIQSNVVLSLAGRTDGNLLPYLLDYDSIVIQLGTGGNVKSMIEVIQFLRSNPEKTVVINGECYSACTMLLGAPDNVLLTNNARLFFHSSSAMECVNGGPYRRLSTNGNRNMMLLFNTEQREWLLTSAAYDSSRFVEMPSALIRQIYWKQWMNTDYIPPNDSKVLDLRMQPSDPPKTCEEFQTLPKTN